MRLINTSTLEFEEFTSPADTDYAILSHTWGSQEVSYREMLEPHSNIASKEGYKKVIGACEFARSHGFKYIWIDTCCIDKSSSAELTETINSMYEYYKSSEICFAYLADAEQYPSSELNLWTMSRWWTRGWTLQELIAPREVWLMAKNWERFNTRNVLAHNISSFTGVPVEVLRHEKKLVHYSIAQRMSWASSRETTRIEDEAYCLLGLMDVNIPLLYGEGRKAFVRLQEEIIRVSADRSILAWSFAPDITDPDSVIAPVLAASPSDYARSSTIPAMFSDSSAYSMTNIGLKISLPLQHINPPSDGNRKIYAALLEGYDYMRSQYHKETIYLRRTGLHTYVRTPQNAASLNEQYEEKEISIAQRNIVEPISTTKNVRGMLFDLIVAESGKLLKEKVDAFSFDPERDNYMVESLLQHGDVKLEYAIAHYPQPMREGNRT